MHLFIDVYDAKIILTSLLKKIHIYFRIIHFNHFSPSIETEIPLQRTNTYAGFLLLRGYRYVSWLPQKSCLI